MSKNTSGKPFLTEGTTQLSGPSLTAGQRRRTSLEQHRTCRRCTKTKLLSEFRGRGALCSPCRSLAAAERIRNISSGSLREALAEVTDLDRLWKCIDTSGSHWLWEGRTNSGGYGQISLGFRVFSVHRVVYELIRGEIPDGYVVDHLCRVRHCCNPDHLEAVTPSENTRRGRAFVGG